MRKIRIEMPGTVNLIRNMRNRYELWRVVFCNFAIWEFVPIVGTFPPPAPLLSHRYEHVCTPPPVCCEQ